MSKKFVIECPVCGKYAEAKTGFFAKKKIDCVCGYTINVRTDKLSSRVCHHCGNNVVFDQSKGESAKCPVCKEPINTMAEQDKTVEFSCAQCGIMLRSSKGAQYFTCPVCDCVNDVAERAKTEEIKRDGLASIIKYEGDANTLVWKHPIEDFNLGSQLIVHESQEAIFFRDGQALDLFGAGRYTLETQQLPVLEKFYKLPTDTEGTFHSEVYYINLATQMGIKWGTDTKIGLFDPMSGIHTEIGASGEFNIRVVNSRKLLLKIVGTTGGLVQSQISNDSKGYFRTMIMTHVKSYLASSIREKSISIIEIDERLMELSEVLRNKINLQLADYGLEISEFYVARIVNDDPNVTKLKAQYAERYLGVREEQIKKDLAEAAAQRKIVEAQTEAQLEIIKAQGSAEAYRTQAAAEADEMRMKGFTYQQETARQVGLEAMQNGLTGNGVGIGGGMGDIASLGIALGAMGSMVDMTKDALNPVMDSAKQMGSAVGGAVLNNGWDCACGNKNITAKFCGECGAQKPEQIATWSCACGATGITSKFCPECGAKKPEGPAMWDCGCGNKGITAKFCGECGAKKPE